MTITIPVTYPGIPDYELTFRREDDVLWVQRPETPEKQVFDWRTTPDSRDDTAVILEINPDLTHGAPIYARLTRDDWEKLRTMKA